MTPPLEVKFSESIDSSYQCRTQKVNKPKTARLVTSRAVFGYFGTLGRDLDSFESRAAGSGFFDFTLEVAVRR